MGIDSDTRAFFSNHINLDCIGEHKQQILIDTNLLSIGAGGPSAHLSLLLAASDALDTD